jgi:hypothetical protein
MTCSSDQNKDRVNNGTDGIQRNPYLIMNAASPGAGDDRLWDSSPPCRGISSCNVGNFILLSTQAASHQITKIKGQLLSFACRPQSLSGA